MIFTSCAIILQGKRGKEPNVTEFIAALAAGNNAQLMVIVCADSAGSTALALGAAAQETGGHAVCILPGLKELHASRKALGCYADFIELVVGDARSLLINDYQYADFVLVDCKMDDHQSILVALQKCLYQKKAFLVGYNAIHCEPRVDGLKSHFLPIGEGLLVTRISSSSSSSAADKFRGARKKGRWVVKVDKITGEEHVYRTTFPNHDQIEA